MLVGVAARGHLGSVWRSKLREKLSFMFALGSITDANCLFFLAPLWQNVFPILWVLSLFSSFRMKSPWVTPPAAPAIYQRWAKHRQTERGWEGRKEGKQKKPEWMMHGLSPPESRALSCSSGPGLLWQGSPPLRSLKASVCVRSPLRGGVIVLLSLLKDKPFYLR